MSDDVHQITVQIRPPKGTFPGEVAIGYYVINPDGYVVLTDENGKPVGDAKQHLDGPSVEARPIACRMLRRQNARSSVTGFNDRISYPKLRF